MAVKSLLVTNAAQCFSNLKKNMTLRSLTIAISNTMALTSTTFSKRIKKEQLQVYEGTHSNSQPTKSPVNSENYIPLKNWRICSNMLYAKSKIDIITGCCLLPILNRTSKS